MLQISLCSTILPRTQGYCYAALTWCHKSADYFHAVREVPDCSSPRHGNTLVSVLSSQAPASS